MRRSDVKPNRAIRTLTRAVLTAAWLIGCACAAPAQPAVEAIDLGTLLRMARETHPLFVQEGLSVLVAEEVQQGLRGDEDWQLRIDSDLYYTEPLEVGVGAVSERRGLGLESALERKIWSTGGRLGFQGVYEYADQDQEEIRFPAGDGFATLDTGPASFHTPGLFAYYQLPLSRNRSGILDQLDYTLQEWTVEQIRLQALESQEAFLLLLSNRFVDWALVEESLRIDRVRLTVAEELQAYIQQKFANNLVERVDVLRNQEETRAAQLSVLQSTSRLHALRQALAAQLDYPRLLSLTPEMDLYAVTDIPHPSQAEAVVRQGNRTLAIVEARASRLDAEVEALANNTRAQVDLRVAGGVKDLEEDFADASALDRPEASVALLYSYPLGNRSAVSDLVRARLQRAETQALYESTRLNLLAELKRVLTRLLDMRKILALNRDRVDLSRQTTDEELALYKQGRNELSFVIRSRDIAQLAFLRYAASAAEYQRLVLTYRALVDDLYPAEDPTESVPRP